MILIDHIFRFYRYNPFGMNEGIDLHDERFQKFPDPDFYSHDKRCRQNMKTAVPDTESFAAVAWRAGRPGRRCAAPDGGRSRPTLAPWPRPDPEKMRAVFGTETPPG